MKKSCLTIGLSHVNIGRCLILATTFHRSARVRAIAKTAEGNSLTQPNGRLHIAIPVSAKTSKIPPVRERVKVFSTEDMLLFYTHAERACAMLANGTVERICKGRSISAVRMVSSIGRPGLPAKQPTAWSYRTTYTYRDSNIVGNPIALKQINLHDEPLFRLAQTDCLAPWRPLAGSRKYGKMAT